LKNVLKSNKNGIPIEKAQISATTNVDASEFIPSVEWLGQIVIAYLNGFVLKIVIYPDFIHHRILHLYKNGSI
jgi:capsule polysaccharide modification protein KpsS